MTKKTFHVLGLAHTQTTSDFVHCAYTEKLRKFCRMMKGLGHTVYLYAGDENDAPCDELITCITREEQKNLIGMEKPTDNLKAVADPGTPYWELFNKRCVEEIKKRAQPRDFIIVSFGRCQKPVADAFPSMMSVEYGIGYEGTFSRFRVFESYSWMHTVYGAQQGADRGNGNWYDAVIPNFFDPNDFPFDEKKDDYFLFIGRLTDRKGYQIAVDVCKKLGKRLVVAGQGTPPTGVDYKGVVGVKERGILMSKAKGVFVPTLYLEPFGGVSVEAMMCGTPIITTDWGAFVENNLHGKTGYRCRTFEQFVFAAENVDKIDPHACRKWALNFSMEKVALMYQEYFDQLSDLWDKGWYTERPREALSWLNRDF